MNRATRQVSLHAYRMTLELGDPNLPESRSMAASRRSINPSIVFLGA